MKKQTIAVFQADYKISCEKMRKFLKVTHQTLCTYRKQDYVVYSDDTDIFIVQPCRLYKTKDLFDKL